MAKTEVAVRRTDSIFDEISLRNEMIRQRAFELFAGRVSGFMSELDDWLNAERELFPAPAIEMREKDGRIEIDADLPGLELRNLDVKVTNEDVLITAQRDEKKAGEPGTPNPPKPETGDKSETAEKTETMLRFFQAIHLPVMIDPDATRAEYRKGHLLVTAPIVRPTGPTAIEIHA